MSASSSTARMLSLAMGSPVQNLLLGLIYQNVGLEKFYVGLHHAAQVARHAAWAPDAAGPVCSNGPFCLLYFWDAQIIF